MRNARLGVPVSSGDLHLDGEECPERIRLADIYSHCLSDLNRIDRDQTRIGRGKTEDDESMSSDARLLSERAWTALERHVAEHACLGVVSSANGATQAPEPARVLEAAAEAALDLILVADDERRFVDVNRATTEMLGLVRHEIVGRRIDEFFEEAKGEPVSTAWRGFVAEGEQSGVCELRYGSIHRRFEYRASANFAPGLHVSILRELP